VNLIIYTSLFLYQASNSIKILRYGIDGGMTIKIIYLLQMEIQQYLSFWPVEKAIISTQTFKN